MITGCVDKEPGAREQAIIGCLLGTAVGDAVGLVCEGSDGKRGRSPILAAQHVTLS